MNWRVRIDRAAAKKLKRLDPQNISQIVGRIRQLAEDPRPQGSRQLIGSKSQGWRIRVGKYRVLYTIDTDAHEVVVYELGPRDQIYRKRK